MDGPCFFDLERKLAPIQFGVPKISLTLFPRLLFLLFVDLWPILKEKMFATCSNHSCLFSDFARSLVGGPRVYPCPTNCPNLQQSSIAQFDAAFVESPKSSQFRTSTTTLPETNSEFTLEDEFPFGMAYFQVQTVSFRECIDIHRSQKNLKSLDEKQACASTLWSVHDGNQPFGARV